VAGSDSTPRWRGGAALAGNVLFGAARQRVVNGSVAAGRGDSAHAARIELQGGYGDAVSPDGDVRAVVVRALRLSAGWDARPYARVSPFVFGLAETSLQQRLASRASGGAGAKYTHWRRGADQDASVSLALLAEQTRALGGVDAGEGTRVRWSLRTRLRRRFAPGWRLSHVTFWQPTVDRPSRYTVETTTVAAAPLRPGLELTATLRDRFDSEARRRGARSNHDGQLLFGVDARF
jgi:hypothetical protein